jgi:aspartyl-tRNA(Asn)/glutamyl-tRNA(Gln) amidotransferase subunit A
MSDGRMRRFTEITDAYATGRDTPVEAMERALARAETDPACAHIFIRLTPDRARREALASAARWRAGMPLGPLDGVPVAAKDLVDVVGTVTTAGSALRRTARPAASDATVAARLSAAGAVLIGKTNLSEFAFSGLGLNPHFGTPDNAVKPGAIPGGSSSGSAVAVALGVVSGAVGTDTSGSIRIPAAFNRVAGFRPSRARISQTGVFPLAPNLDSVGPLAACVQDLAHLDAVFRHGETIAATGPRRLCVPVGGLGDGMDAEVQDAFEATVAHLAHRGWTVTRRSFPSLETVTTLLAELGSLATWEAAGVHRHLLEHPDQMAALDPLVGSRLRSGADMPLERVEALRTARPGMVCQFTDELAGDLLLLPSVCCTVPTRADCERSLAETMALNVRVLRNTMVLSFVDAPGVSLPMGEAGTAMGVLLSGAAGDDTPVLGAAFALETALA